MSDTHAATDLSASLDAEPASPETPAPRHRPGASSRVHAGTGLADGIGWRLAAYREQRGLRVSYLARQIGVSPSLISQIERGQARPSVSTLFAMAQVLDVPVDAFFRARHEEGSPDEAEESPAGTGHGAADRTSGRQSPEPAMEAGAENRYVVRHGNRAAIDIEGDIRWERLTPRTLPHLDFLELVYGPHAESNPNLYTHAGNEMVLVTCGVLDITVSFERYRLRPGDSMHLPASMPHRYANPTSETTRAVTVILYDCPAPAAPAVRRSPDG